MLDLGMITSLIRKVAEERGLQNANQLGTALEVSPNLAARLWRGNFVQLGRVTIDRLCRVLKCQPGQLLRYAPTPRKR